MHLTPFTVIIYLDNTIPAQVHNESNNLVVQSGKIYYLLALYHTLPEFIKLYRVRGSRESEQWIINHEFQVLLLV